ALSSSILARLPTASAALSLPRLAASRAFAEAWPASVDASPFKEAAFFDASDLIVSRVAASWSRIGRSFAVLTVAGLTAGAALVAPAFAGALGRVAAAFFVAGVAAFAIIMSSSRSGRHA